MNKLKRHTNRLIITLCFLCLHCFSLQAQLNYTIRDSVLIVSGKDSLSPFIEIDLLDDFVTAAVAEHQSKYKMASFHFKEKLTRKCNKMQGYSIAHRDNKLTIKGKLAGKDCQCKFSLTLQLINEQELDFQVMIHDPDFNHVTFKYLSDKDEHYFGFGEQPSYIDMKGKKPHIWCEEQGIGRGDPPVTFFANFAGAGGNAYTSYAPVPFYISGRNRAMFLANTGYIQYNFKKDDESAITAWNNYIAGSIWTADTPLELLELFTDRTGRFPELPDWAYGTWMGLQGGTKEVTKHIDEAMQAGNPVTALWIQDWVGRRQTRFGSQLWWRWLPDETLYPDFAHFRAAINDKGIKLIGYINPFLADTGRLFETAREKGYLVKDRNGNDYEIETPGFPAYLVDLTNPSAYNWLKKIIKTHLIDLGFSGWMADYGEWLPLDVKLHSGADPWLYHNIYPVDWARLNREAIREAGKEGEIVFFNRSGYSNSAKYSTLFWAGDQMVTWKKHDGLPSAITSLLSGGMSGITLNHSDIGGYTTVKKLLRIRRSKKLLFRWIEANTFTPVFRTHEGLIPSFNAQVYSDQESIDFFSRFGKLHYALKDYLKYYVKEAAEKGYPVVRPLYLHYPEDENTYHLNHQFLTGEDLLVIPVIKKRKEKVKGYFPAGLWQNAFSGTVVKGPGFHKVAAPLGFPAVYIRQESQWTLELINIFRDFVSTEISGN